MIFRCLFYKIITIKTECEIWKSTLFRVNQICIVGQIICEGKENMAKIKCQKCGKAIDDNANFCRFCGHDISVKIEQAEIPLQKQRKKLPIEVLLITVIAFVIVLYVVALTMRHDDKRISFSDPTECETPFLSSSLKDLKNAWELDDITDTDLMEDVGLVKKHGFDYWTASDYYGEVVFMLDGKEVVGVGIDTRALVPIEYVYNKKYNKVDTIRNPYLSGVIEETGFDYLDEYEPEIYKDWLNQVWKMEDGYTLVQYSSGFPASKDKNDGIDYSNSTVKNICFVKKLTYVQPIEGEWGDYCYNEKDD